VPVAVPLPAGEISGASRLVIPAEERSGNSRPQQSGATRPPRPVRHSLLVLNGPPVAPWTQSYLAVLTAGRLFQATGPGPSATCQRRAQSAPIGSSITSLKRRQRGQVATALSRCQATASPVSPGTPTSAPRQEHGQDQPTSWCVRGRASWRCFTPTVTENGDFDVLLSGAGPEPTSPRTAVQRGRRSWRHTSHPADAHSACSEPRSCTLHPSRLRRPPVQTWYGSPVPEQDPLHRTSCLPPFDEVVLVADALLPADRDVEG